MGKPTGTVAFLFTDIVSSTELWQSDHDRMAMALELHDSVVRDSVDAGGGVVFATGGDGFAAAFETVDSAALCALSIRDGLADADMPLAVRFGMSAGPAIERDDDYFGPTVIRAARVMGLAAGGQILLSAEAAGLLSGGQELTPIGVVNLRGLGDSELFQIGIEQHPPIGAAAAGLPSVPTALIGRTSELIVLDEALRVSRLITLVGPGGAGKTHLAIELASRTHFRDGVAFVDLSTISVEAAVDVHILRSLGIPERPGVSPRVAVTDWLRRRSMLVVVDNCEHVIDAAAASVSAVIQACPAVSVVTTSREALRLDGELEVPLAGLDEVDAVELFESIAGGPAASRADLRLLCRQLDGLPLAVQLAAARARSIGVQGFTESFGEGLGALTSKRRDVPDRHRSVRSALEWSYNLLDPDEAEAFVRLSIFIGPFTVRDAASLLDSHAARSALLLESLVDKSMVATDDDQGRWFRLLETMRQFGEEQLATDRDKRDGTAEAFRSHHVSGAAEVCDQLLGPGWEAAHTALHRGLPNMQRAALLCGDAGALDDLMAIVHPYFFDRRSLVDLEPIAWVEYGLARAPKECDTTMAEAFLACQYTLDGSVDAARARLPSPREVDVRADVNLPRYLGTASQLVGATTGDLDLVRAGNDLLTDATLPCASTGDRAWRLSQSCYGLIAVGEEDRALAASEEAADAALSCGSVPIQGFALFFRGRALAANGDPRAASTLADAIDANDRAGLRAMAAISTVVHASVELERGEIVPARAALASELRYAIDAGESFIAKSIVETSLTLAGDRHDHEAKITISHALSSRGRMGYEGRLLARWEAELETAHQLLPPGRVASLLAKADSMTDEDLYRYVFERLLEDGADPGPERQANDT